MANEVSNILDITFPEEMRDRVEEIVNRINEEDNLHCVYDNVEMTRDWYENNIGAKWARLNDAPTVDYGSAYLNVGSAWHEISGFVERFNELTASSSFSYSSPASRAASIRAIPSCCVR